MTTLAVQKLMPISEDGVAHVPLGEGYAGRTLLVEEREPGVWVLRAVTVIPDNERWLHTPEFQERLREAAKLGFTSALIPKANAPKQPIEGLNVMAVDRLEQAIDRVRDLE